MAQAGGLSSHLSDHVQSRSHIQGSKGRLTSGWLHSVLITVWNMEVGYSNTQGWIRY